MTLFTVVHGASNHLETLYTTNTKVNLIQQIWKSCALTSERFSGEVVTSDHTGNICTSHSTVFLFLIQFFSSIFYRFSPAEWKLFGESWGSKGKSQKPLYLKEKALK